jgi:CRP-like cAMP-binding protein
MESVGLRPLLREDPDLADTIPQPIRAAAGPRVLIQVVEIGRRSSGSELGPPTAAGLGLLMLRGLLLRRIEVMSKLSYELLGPGDLITRLTSELETEVLLPHAVSWRALDDVRIAVLDDAFLERVAPWPRLSHAITTRGLRRADSVSLERALAQLRVDVRMDLLLWHLASRWGKVIGDGLIRLTLPVTHEILAHIAGCSRPTATWALSRLAELRLIEREAGAWLIQGSLQRHLVRLQESGAPVSPRPTGVSAAPPGG